MCVWVGMLVHCFVMQLLLSFYVCVVRDVSSLFCDVVVALIVCVRVGGDVSSLLCDVIFALYCMYVCVVGGVSSLFCDVVVALYCMCVCGGMLVHCFVM